MSPVDTLEGLDRKQLIARWQSIVGGAPPPHLSMPLMRHVLAFQMQAKTQGGLSRSLRKKIEQCACDQDGAARGKPASGLKPGARLVREWNGVAHRVDVTADGYVWNGVTYRSLSAIARAITGARWSGPRFFGLTAGETRR